MAYYISSYFEIWNFSSYWYNNAIASFIFKRDVPFDKNEEIISWKLYAPYNEIHIPESSE